MKTPLKVGDRVAVYGAGDARFIYFGSDRLIGNIRSTQETGTVKIEIENLSSQDTEGHNAVIKVHSKQCRRLVKKERRRIWVKKTAVDYVMADGKHTSGTISKSKLDAAHYGTMVEFIEVRK